MFKHIKLIAPYKVEGIKNCSMNDAISYLNTRYLIAVDCETRPHPDWKEIKDAAITPYLSQIVMLQVGDKHNQYVIDTRFIDPKPLLKAISNKIWVTTNGKFDYTHIKIQYETVSDEIIDIMLNERILKCGMNTPKGYFGLKSMVERYLEKDFSTLSGNHLLSELNVSKEVRETFADIGFNKFSLTQIVYGANDVWMPFEVLNHQLIKLSEYNMIELMCLESAFLVVLANMEIIGMYLDSEKWMENYDNYLIKTEKIESELKNIADINWNSSKQVIEVFKEHNIPTQIVDKTKSSGANKVYKDSVAVGNIKKYEDKYPLIKQYLYFKKLKKLTTSYGEKFLKHINPVTGRIHSNFFQILNTGRIASSNPNLQQVPSKDEGFRECFIPSKEDNILVICDYSSQESRILADYSKEQVMIDLFNSDDPDIHSLTASRMFNKPISEVKGTPLRHIGKTLNFSISYGASANKLKDTFQIPLNEAQEFIDLYYKGYPNLKIYFDNAKQETLDNGYITIDPVFNRRSYIAEYEEYIHLKNYINNNSGNNQKIPSKVWSRYYLINGKITRDSQNYKIQGSAASMTKYAAVLFWQKYKDNPEVNIVNIIHDEIVVECPKKIADIVSDNLKDSMETAGKIFVKTIPMIANPVIWNYWKH